MKKLLFLLIIPLFFACGSDDEKDSKDNSMRNVTTKDLESTFGTIVNNDTYLSFKGGSVLLFIHAKYGDSYTETMKYRLSNDSIYFTTLWLGEEKETFSACIQLMEWGDKNKDDQIFIFKGDKEYSKLRYGAYDKSSIKL